MFEYSTRAYGSQFSGETNGLKIRYLVAEILSKKVVSFFLGHPVESMKCFDIKNTKDSRNDMARDVENTNV